MYVLLFFFMYFLKSWSFCSKWGLPRCVFSAIMMLHFMRLINLISEAHEKRMLIKTIQNKRVPAVIATHFLAHSL